MRVSTLFILLVAGFSVVQAQSTHPAHAAVTPADMKWGPAPAGLPPGAQLAVLSGDPGKPGPFAISLRFPDGFTIPPHWHPTDENLVITQGTFMVGAGDKFVESSMKTLTAGSYAVMPLKTNHFARAKGQTTLVMMSTGPFEITYVNPNDDPRKKK
jgi:quercetin dioxygenase-like cupin family protein